jgi:signal transduction histidine kinase
VTAFLDRLRSNPVVVDVLLALGLTALSLVPMLGTGPDVRSLHPVSVALLLLQTLPLAFRRAQPVPVLVVTGLATVSHGLLAGDVINSSLGSLFALYTVAERYPPRMSFIGALLLGGSLGVVIASKAALQIALGSIVQTWLATIVAWLLGAWSRDRRAYVGTVEERALRAEQDRESRALRAVDEERSRIARELHDVITHHVSVIVIQAGAARRALERRPADAGQAIEAIDDAGRQALTDMRRMLGILGTPAGGTDGDPREPMPGLDRLGELLESVRAAGLPVELSVVGDRRVLDPGIELSAYRIIQEALTNALKHARGAHARVTVRYDPAALEIRVSDEGGTGSRGIAEPSGQGRGLIGMRERVAMFGGEFEAGPAGQGFRVHARLPVASPVTSA